MVNKVNKQKQSNPNASNLQLSGHKTVGLFKKQTFSNGKWKENKIYQDHVTNYLVIISRW